MATVQHLLIACVVVTTMAACVPTATQPARPVNVEFDVDPSAVDYHPTQAGIVRTYTTEQGGSEIHEEHVGLTVRSGIPYQVLRTRGGGRDTRTYQRHTSAGVFKAIEITPNYELNYDPPMQTLPDSLRVGQTWKGTSTATFKRDDEPKQQVEVHYNSRVTEQREARINGRAYTFFVIQTEGFDENGEPVARQERWYVPYLGDVKTADDLFLVHTNLQGLP